MKKSILLIAKRVTTMQTATNAENNGITVNLQIEGDEVACCKGRITIQSDGTHKCNGNNRHLGSIRVPTVTDALDTALKRRELTWGGSVYIFEFYYQIF